MGRKKKVHILEVEDRPVVDGTELQDNRRGTGQIDEPRKETLAQVTTKTWSLVTTEQKLITKDMSFKFIAPYIQNGRNVVKIDKTEVGKLSDIWANIVLLYVVGQTPLICAIIRFINIK